MHGKILKIVTGQVHRANFAGELIQDVSLDVVRDTYYLRLNGFIKSFGKKTLILAFILMFLSCALGTHCGTERIHSTYFSFGPFMTSFVMNYIIL